MTKELLQQAAEASGRHPLDILDFVRSAKWDSGRLAAELQRDAEWFDRLWTDVVDEYAEGCARCVGPQDMRALTDDAARALMAPALRRALDSFTGAESVLMIGTTGAGKTLAAMLMLRKIVRRTAKAWLANRSSPSMTTLESNPPSSRGCIWADALELQVGAARHPLGQGPAPEVRAAKMATLLVVDDVAWAERDHVMLEIVAHRYNTGRPTIYTAGLPRKELVARLGDAVTRKMIELSGKKGILVEV